MKCVLCQADNPAGSEKCSGCGRPLPVATGLLGPGSMLSSRYEILSLLGRGGMGIVYKAQDRVLEETVALKVLLSDVAEAADMAQRFRSEIKLARKVRHRNVCAIHEWGEEGPLRFITMEFIEGRDLKHLLHQRGGLPPAEAFDVTIQLAEGLQAIHDAGVVHRDLKTSNVMIDRAGIVRLMDFGIAKQLGLEGSPAATAVGHILGTPEYMSPEQARGVKIDFRSDLYALGVVIYEVFTGHVPFHGNTPIATLFKQLEEPLRIEGPEAEMIPSALVPLLRKVLAKEPNERYQSARELAEALREARARTLPPPPPPPVEAQSELEPKTTTLTRATPPPLVSATSVMPPTMRGATPAPRRDAAGAPRTRPEPRIVPPAPPLQPKPRPPTERNIVPWLAAFVVAFALAGTGMVLGLRALLRTGPADPTLAAMPGPAPSPGASGPEAGPEPSTASLPPATMAPAPPAVTPPPTTPPHLATTPPPATTAPPPGGPQPTVPPASPAARERAPAPVPPPPQHPVPSPAEATGVLQMRVTPWAEVSVDGSPIGTTPLKPLRLAAGTHAVRFSHPDYKPLQRKITLRPGETTKLEVDLTWEAVPR